MRNGSLFTREGDERGEVMNDREVVFVSAARTPIGDFGGSLKDLRLGHPVGMTGLRIVITLIYEMRRRG